MMCWKYKVWHLLKYKYEGEEGSQGFLVCFALEVQSCPWILASIVISVSPFAFLLVVELQIYVYCFQLSGKMVQGSELPQDRIIC